MPRLQRDAQSVPLLVAKAILRDFEGQYDAAETIYRDILAKEPDNPTVLNNLAVLLSLQDKNVDEASKLIDLAIQKVGPTPGLLDSRAMVRMAMGKPELALADLRQAIKKGPTADARISTWRRPISRAASARPPSKHSRRPNRLGSRKSISSRSSAPRTRG